MEPNTQKIKGELKSIRYDQSKDGTISFIIGTMVIAGEKTETNIVGETIKPSVMDQIELTGEWFNHPKFGRQFKFGSCIIIPPNTVEGIAASLGSGKIKGVGKKLAQRIVGVFGTETFNVIRNESERLTDVPGIGRGKALKICASFREQEASMEIMAFLQEHSISPAYALKVYRRYGADAVAIVKNNPYQLACDIPGIGFKLSDKIALALGFQKDSPFRIRAGVLFTLAEKNKSGHVYYPYGLLTTEAGDLLEVDTDKVRTEIEFMDGERAKLEESRSLWKDENRKKTFIIIERVTGGFPADDPVYEFRVYNNEKNLASRLKKLLNCDTILAGVSGDMGDQIKEAEQELKIRFDEVQKTAIKTACTKKVAIVTGGPGTGKTTIIRGISHIYSKHQKKIVMCAPTGRAANRMSEATGFESSTIHRLLCFSYEDGFQHDENNPLEGDLFIVDESSMVDTQLMHSFVRALPETATLVLIGDVDQLPSVGAGNVLSDLIDSETIPCVRLTQIFRQSEASAIITAAHAINNGKMPVLHRKEDGKEFWFIEQEDPVKVQEEIISIMCREFVEQDSKVNCQVLTPIRRGPLGTIVLNDILQSRLNKETIEVRQGSNCFKLGDKVMQIRNNYNKEVFNGDVGFITEINKEDQDLIVNYGSKLKPFFVSYDFGELDELTLAYACTIHKSQGSEYTVAIMPITTAHYIMLTRNLIYTGITRGKHLVILVGTKKALAMAIHNNKENARFTRLKERLSGEAA